MTLTANLVLEIQQAYFGAVNGTSHGELASSLSDRQLRAFLAGVTDRPGVPPAGFTLQPYLTATSTEGYFLICRTWPDTAVERQGMVFTHVLMLPLGQLDAVPTLGPVLDLLLRELPSPADRPATLAPLTLPVPESNLAERAREVPASWLVVVQQLVNATESAPVYTTGGTAHFQALLVALWQGLPASLRAKLSWGIRFVPPRDRSLSPLLVHIPAELEGKWRGNDVIVLATKEMGPPERPVERMIFSAEYGSKFRDFMAAIDVSPASFDVLKRCQRAYHQYTSLLEATADAGELLALVRTLRQLQPDHLKAIVIKRDAVEALAISLAAGEGTEALALRGVPMEAFQTGIARLGVAVENVVKRTVTTVSQDTTLQSNLLEYLAETDFAIVERWWHEVATAAFAQVLAAGSEEVAQVIWLGLAGSGTVRAYALGAIPGAAAWERTLVQTIPMSLTVEVADAVASFSAKRGWWDLFAAAVGAAYAPVEALRKQVGAESSLKLHESPRVSRLATHVADGELVKLAVELSNQQLRQLAGEACGRDPGLLAPLDVTQQAWRTIWSVSLEQTSSLVAGLNAVEETISAFLTEVAEGRASEAPPLKLIAASTYANVLHLPKRAALWDKLPAELRQKFVAATLDALVEEILSSRWEGAIEHVLMVRAQDPTFTGKFLGQKRDNPTAVLTIDSVFHNLTDSYLKDYVANLNSITKIEAVQMGKLVVLKRWSQSANVILSKARYIADFRPALAACSVMFSKLDKFFNSTIFGYQVTKDDAWSALEELMAKLYEGGPEQDNIWKRAGGNVTKLSNSQTRGEQWAAAIRHLRNGGGKDITAEKLIQAALEEWPKNSQLQMLASWKHLIK